MKPRTCPVCRQPIPIGVGYYFDDETDGLLCGSCGRTAYPTKQFVLEEQKELQEKLELDESS